MSISSLIARLSRAAVYFVLGLTFFARPARAEEAAPSWMALPDETVLIARVPGGQAFVEALRQQTKLGTALLSGERLNRLVEIIREQSPQTWDSVREALGRVDLKPEDWKDLFQGELGAALTLELRADRTPLLVVLGWLEPGEDLAKRLIAALGSALAEQTDSPTAAKRKDIELAGHEVMHVELPLTDISMPELPDDDGSGDASEAELERRVEKFKARLKEAKRVEVDRLHFFVSRLGGRILWACTIPQSGAEVRKKSDAEREAIDWDVLTGLEEATAVFGRYLAAHEGAGQPPKLIHAPGLEASLPGGTPLVEIMADPRQLLEWGEQSRNPRTKQLLDAVGAKGLGPIALRIALDGSTLRTGGLVSMPGPRAGLLALIDQPPLEPEPPAWVPASAVGYQQFSLQLGKLYDRLQDMAVELAGDTGRQSFDQLDSTVKTFLQVGLSDLLASLEERISVVSFAPRLSEAGEVQGDDDKASASPRLIQRVGIVCRIKDDDLWQKVLAVGGRLGLRSVEEQGFNGLRIEQGENSVGVFTGQGYLVVGVGPEVSESLLSVLRTPPEGAGAMRTSGLVERGRALISPQPCLTYELEDAGASVRVTRQLLESLLSASLSVRVGQPGGQVAGGAALFTPAGQPANVPLLQKLKALLPSDDELEGVMGVSVSQTVATDDGLLLQSAVELPAP